MSFVSTSQVFFVRRNVCVFGYLRSNSSAEAGEALGQVCGHIDALIKNAPPQCEAKAPFKIEIDKTTAAIGQKVILKVTPERMDIPFTVACFQLEGPKLQIERPTGTLK